MTILRVRIWGCPPAYTHTTNNHHHHYYNHYNPLGSISWPLDVYHVPGKASELCRHWSEPRLYFKRKNQLMNNLCDAASNRKKLFQNGPSFLGSAAFSLLFMKKKKNYESWTQRRSQGQETRCPPSTQSLRPQDPLSCWPSIIPICTNHSVSGFILEIFAPSLTSESAMTERDNIGSAGQISTSQARKSHSGKVSPVQILLW